jgi:hypothetical protein
MVKLPPWDTPTWLLPRELRPFYAAVNRLHQLEAKSGASPAEITAARHAVGIAGVQWCGAPVRLGSSKRSEQLCVTSGERDASRFLGHAMADTMD